MNKTEFDQFVEEYTALHKSNIRLSGESPDYFAEYKVLDTVGLIRANDLPSNLAILDFGAGVGNSVPFFKKHLPDAKLTCLDISEKSLDMAKKCYTGFAEYKLFDGHTIPLPDGTFDLVFTACVFHHIPHEEHVHLFEEIFRVTKPGGVFVVFEHNPLNPLTVHAVNTCPFDKNAELIKASILNSKISAAGFESSEITYRLFFPAVLAFLRGIERFLKKLPIGAQYYVSGIKKN